MKKNTIILDLQYLPPIQWFAEAMAYEKVYLESQENYSKGSYRNRCHIVAAQGIQRLTVPLSGGKSSQMPIQNVKISYDADWQHQHWHSIQSAYGNAPFFEFYVDDIKPFYEKKYTSLWEWNYQLLQCINEALGLDIDLHFTTVYNKEVAAKVKDYRNGVHPNPKKAASSTVYEAQPYEQVFAEKHGFLPNMSILDALFCKGPETLLLF